ncbi:hypothetical protein TrCOL_g426 [Triparma columacea]|uniref:Uncharacterized protein n=1 Tax=Triparma columacea TaxID=722753 RepID=A0A9W7LC31_9STRA|nr:hypothetical protein TrCOL_g426 [Triparma columacea]
MSASDKDIPRAQEMIRNRDPELTYGESMDVMKNKIYNPTFAGNGCYKIRASKNAQCCAGKVVGRVVAFDTPCCVWTPLFITPLLPLSALIGLCCCNCRDDNGLASYSFSDAKGNFTAYVPCDEDGTIACFTGNKFTDTVGDQMKVGYFLEK